MEAQGADHRTDPQQVKVAARLAKEVIDCDPAILSLLVVNKTGDVIAVERSSRLSQSEFLSPELIPKFGVLAKVIIGAAGNATPLLGGMEFIIGAFKNEKILLFNLQEYDMALAMRIARSSNAEYVCHKIGERLATRT